MTNPRVRAQQRALGDAGATRTWQNMLRGRLGQRAINNNNFSVVLRGDQNRNSCAARGAQTGGRPHLLCVGVGCRSAPGQQGASGFSARKWQQRAILLATLCAACIIVRKMAASSSSSSRSADDVIDELEEEELAAEPATCLLCPLVLPSVPAALAHMAADHAFSLPDAVTRFGARSHLHVPHAMVL